MPDPPPSKRRRGQSAAGPCGTPTRAFGRSTPRFAELHCKTNFSFLEGASHPDELVHRAVELGLDALAITDKNSLAGVVRAHVAAKEVGLRLLIGAEITLLDAPAVVLLATGRAAYGRLCRLITLGRRRAAKGQCRITFDDLAQHSEGLIAAVLPTHAQSASNPPCSHESSRLNSIARFRDAFADRCYLLAELHLGPNDERHLEHLIELAHAAGVPLVAANDVHYHEPGRKTLQDVLVCVRHGCTVSQAGDRLFPNAERRLKSAAQMAELFARVPDALDRTIEIARRCRFSLDELRYEYPEELCPAGETPLSFLTRLTWEGARRHYSQGVPDKVRRLIEHELALIAELGYEAYFLTVWDLVRFARSRGILCQGRGSAANSAVCFCLGVTAVDPDRIDLLFERFVSRERNEAPDIDVDFEHERREEVLQYIYAKYGRDRAGIAASLITYQPRSAVRDVGKALGLSLDCVDRLAKTLDPHGDEANLEARCREAGLDPTSPVARRLVQLVRELIGFPRHLSQHVGGMVITRGPLCELVPIENAAMPGRTVIEWDKDDLEDLGILKVDCLALGMLTAVHKCFDLVAQSTGQPLTLATIPAEDPAVYEMIGRADTMGVFQIESRAQMAMLPRLRPNCFYDLVIEVAIVRPGPIQGDMVHPYLRRRAGEEPIEYPNPAVRQVLHKTLGVPLFQEQAMRLAVVAAGFTPGQADQLRRAMGGWRRPGLIEQFRKKLIDGMTANGFSPEYAERVFRQIRGFGEYGFPESHAASFALLVYVSAWLKCYHPAAFTAALLNSQPMGFYAPAQLVRDAQNHGVEVRPVDVNASDCDGTLESRPPAVRLGFRMICGLARSAAEAIVQARGDRPFRSIADFARRTRAGQGVLARLAKADAFGSLGLDRRAALWHALASAETPPLFETVEQEEPSVHLPKLTQAEEVVADYRMTGLSLKRHPMSLVRRHLDHARIVPAAKLCEVQNGRWVRTAGLVLLRQRPSTAKGITFMTLEDETGTANLLVRPEIWERYRPVARAASALIAHGRLQNQAGVIHLLVRKLENLSAALPGVIQHSRDFR
jgi:error-prone DNA polymerase